MSLQVYTILTNFKWEMEYFCCKIRNTFRGILKFCLELLCCVADKMKPLQLTGPLKYQGSIYPTWCIFRFTCSQPFSNTVTYDMNIQPDGFVLMLPAFVVEQDSNFMSDQLSRLQFSGQNFQSLLFADHLQFGWWLSLIFVCSSCAFVWINQTSGF